MIIQKLTVTHVRSHENKAIILSPRVSVITGNNGVGKTTLLEAIYIALRGTSFKGSDNDILGHAAPWYRIELNLDDETSRTVTFDPSRTTGKKKFIIDDKTSARIPVKSKYPIVLFEPEDLRLLHGSPSRRRLFIDTFITQADPAYGTLLRKYERIIKQRNTLLKRETLTREDLFPWNIALSEYGAKIIEYRVRAVSRINDVLRQSYLDIAHTDDLVTVDYSHPTAYTSQDILQQLESAFAYDTAVKHTSVGPHRHDILFYFNNFPALSVASRGEVRTILLALKRIEAEIITEITGKKPIILLDDVFSELDKERQEYIINYFKDNQVIISSATHLSGADFLHIEL